MYLWAREPLLVLASTILWGFYVLFTILTFRQIRKQTDLLAEAFLVVAFKKVQDYRVASDIPFERTAFELHEKWSKILTKHVPNAVRKESALLLTLTNRGRADIIKWSISVTARVDPGEYLLKEYNTHGEMVSWSVASAGAKHIVQPEKPVEVVLAPIGNFPNVEFTWSIAFEDMRGKKYVRAAGDSSVKDTNALALFPPPPPSGATGEVAPA
jgi:hypothetical protein